MKLKLIHIVSALAAVATAPSQGRAAVLYSNGPCNCQTAALEIDGGHAVSDSFTLAGTSSISQIDFGAWTALGDNVAAVDWSILTASPVVGGTVIDSGTSYIQAYSGYENTKHYAVYVETFPLDVQRIAAGTYWLTLTNAVSDRGGKLYWDVNNGHSAAYEPGVGPVNSESFQLLGGAPTPEPAAWSLILAGFGGLGAMLRRARRASEVSAAA
jgi:hypothetical protein